MRKFVLKGPDGVVASGPPVAAESVVQLTEKLVDGYSIAGEVLPGPTNEIFVVPPLPDGLKRYTLVTWMLTEHGDEFLEWMAEQAGGRK